MQTDPAHVAASHQTFPSLKLAVTAIVLLIAINVVGFVDIQLFAVMAPAVKNNFQLSDSQLGTLQGLALALGGALAFLPCGYIIDRANRLRFILTMILIWSLCSLLTGLSETYSQIFMCRVLLSAAQTGLAPATFSLIADYFAPRYRGQAFLAFYGAIFLLVAISMSLIGILIRHLEGASMALPFGIGGLPAWRAVFVLSVLPGIVVALLLLAFREPARHVEGDSSVQGQSMLQFLAGEGRTTLMLLLGGTVSFMGFQAMMFWMPSILQRSFAFDAAEASQALGMVVGVSSLGGVAIGSLLTRLVTNRSPLPLVQLRVMRFGIAGSFLLVPLIAFATTSTLVIASWLAFSIAAYIANTAVPALLTTATPSAMRGRIFVIQNFSTIMVFSFAPLFTGFMADKLFAGVSANPLLQACVWLGGICSGTGLILSAGKARKVMELSGAEPHRQH